jgi:hypothetical protein
MADPEVGGEPLPTRGRRAEEPTVSRPATEPGYLTVPPSAREQFPAGSRGFLRLLPTMSKLPPPRRHFFAGKSRSPLTLPSSKDSNETTCPCLPSPPTTPTKYRNIIQLSYLYQLSSSQPTN